MDSLVTYVNNTFSGVPQTEEIKNLKSEILNRMQSGFNDLKNDGKSDEEAVGIIISEFSNISDLINEKLKDHNTAAFNNEHDRVRFIKALMSSYWIIVVIFYLLVSFMFRIWDISWLIFLIAVAFKKFCKSYYDL